MAEPKTKEDQQFVNDHYGYTYFWIGLKKAQNQWVWDSTKEVITEPTDWYPGEPSGTGDCALLIYGGAGWGDDACDYSTHALCQS